MVSFSAFQYLSISASQLSSFPAAQLFSFSAFQLFSLSVFQPFSFSEPLFRTAFQNRFSAFQKMLVRIGIVTKNRASVLAKAIESALAQDYPHKEVVVYDDA
ncbi:MAG: glycosyltransferase [Verrucomicrobiales bacterium]|nr:glycosyltransferase [Verrucomicrobiales bacterium]